MNDPSDNLDLHQHYCPTCRLHRWCDALECRETINKVCLDDDPLYKEIPLSEDAFWDDNVPPSTQAQEDEWAWVYEGMTDNEEVPSP